MLNIFKKSRNQIITNNPSILRQPLQIAVMYLYVLIFYMYMHKHLTTTVEPFISIKCCFVCGTVIRNAVVINTFTLCILLPVRNIPKFKDRGNWSRDTFQPVRRRACVYQQTNQNIAPVIKSVKDELTVLV